MATKTKRNFAASFDAVANRRQDSLQNKLEAANQRIAELEVLIEEQEVHKIPLNMIEPNPHQPRQSFYDVEQMKNLLQLQGQKEPITLVKIPVKDKYIIFDGERRYRAHHLLEWSTIDAVFIPYNPQTFQEDVLIAALNKSSINALDEAEAIVKRIQQEIDLNEKEIADQLLSFISYTRRRDKLEDLKYLTTIYEDRGKYIDALNFRNEKEKTICLTIVNLGRSCISISSNKFPLLKLSSDLKKSIRERGLNERIALHLNGINSHSKKLKGKITDKKALKLRQELVNKILNNGWSVRDASVAIKNAIQEITGDTKPSIVKTYTNYLERIEPKKLTQLDKELLLEQLQNLITKIENS